MPAVSVGIRKQAGANTIAVIDDVKSRMAVIIPNLPSDMKVALIRDQSEFIQNSLTAIEEHLVLGGVACGRRRISVPLEFPFDDHCCARDPDFDHRGICCDRGLWVIRSTR